jgi:signal transduction histidine kinase
VLGHLSVGGSKTRSTSGEAGEGIGLSIVKRLCEMLDATIEMQSVPNVGTTSRIFSRDSTGINWPHCRFTD